MLHILVKFLRALSSEASPWQIAVAVTLGMIMGITPLLRLHNLLILFVALFFRINIGSFLASFILFSGIAWLFDPWLDQLGGAVLMASGLQDLWTALFNTGLGRLSQFNHTLTLGGLLAGLILAPLVLFGTRYLVIQYRSRVLTWVNRLHIVRALRASKLMRLYSYGRS